MSEEIPTPPPAPKSGKQSIARSRFAQTAGETIGELAGEVVAHGIKKVAQTVSQRTSKRLEDEEYLRIKERYDRAVLALQLQVPVRDRKESKAAMLRVIREAEEKHLI